MTRGFGWTTRTPSAGRARLHVVPDLADRHDKGTRGDAMCRQVRCADTVALDEAGAAFTDTLADVPLAVLENPCRGCFVGPHRKLLEQVQELARVARDRDTMNTRPGEAPPRDGETMSITLDRTEPVLATGDWNVVLVPAGQRAPGNAKPLPVANEDTIHVYIAAHAGKPGFSEHGQHWGSIDLATAIDRAHRGAAWIPYGGSKELVVTANDFRAIRDWALGNHAAGGIGRAYFAHREREVRFTNYGAGRRFNALLRAHLARYEALLDCGYDEDPGAAFAAFAHDVGVIDDDARANRHALGVFDGLGDAQWDAAAKLFGEAANR